MSSQISPTVVYSGEAQPSNNPSRARKEADHCDLRSRIERLFQKRHYLPMGSAESDYPKVRSDD
jgi:hypothetical protein